MISHDKYGLNVSAYGNAVAAWAEGLENSLSFDASGIPALQMAVELAPDFALAHATLAHQQMVQGLHAKADASLAKAIDLYQVVSDREASQIEVLAATMQYKNTALELALAHLENWPLDVFVFSLVIGPFGLLAVSEERSWRTGCLSLLEKYQKDWPSDDWWYLSNLGYALAECGQTAAANDVALQAWQSKPSGHCAHTLSHVHYEQGDARHGQKFLQEWLSRHRRESVHASDMRHHLVWHEALYELEHGTATQAWMTQLYEMEFDPKISDPMPLVTFADNVSFLWRCSLYNIPLNTKFSHSMFYYGLEHFPDLGYIFVDVHRVLVTALLGLDSNVNQLRSDIQQLKQTADAVYLNRLLDGAVAFTHENYSYAARCLEPILDETVHIGGSNLQRNVVHQTYARAKRLTLL